ncbi:hypothetical protein [Nocardiopsis dassonvillei]|uniref:hypothetical protein n=1 Tax=Nocardiopsis dassonvillei TaxID=2014 RepID=UPI0033F6663F
MEPTTVTLLASGIALCGALIGALIGQVPHFFLRRSERIRHAELQRERWEESAIEITLAILDKASKIDDLQRKIDSVILYDESTPLDPSERSTQLRDAWSGEIDGLAISMIEDAKRLSFYVGSDQISHIHAMLSVLKKDDVISFDFPGWVGPECMEFNKACDEFSLSVKNYFLRS